MNRIFFFQNNERLLTKESDDRLMPSFGVVADAVIVSEVIGLHVLHLKRKKKINKNKNQTELR
jgi:hypothetical protein